jgi:hypothetical protein
MIANEYHLSTYDPGGAGTGWTKFVVDFRAFSRPENKILRWIKSWESGCLKGTEEQMCQQAAYQMRTTVDAATPGSVSYLSYDVVSEGFDLTQLIGGRELLSPVRINAVLAWECSKRAIKFHEQARQMRTNVTRDRLKQFGFRKRWQKDEFAAMQHAIVWLRRLKQESRKHPWKLSEGSQLNAYWDCDCCEGLRCDMLHPR